MVKTTEFSHQTLDAISSYGIAGLAAGRDPEACEIAAMIADHNQKMRRMLLASLAPC